MLRNEREHRHQSATLTKSKIKFRYAVQNKGELVSKFFVNFNSC